MTDSTPHQGGKEGVAKYGVVGGDTMAKSLHDLDIDVWADDALSSVINELESQMDHVPKEFDHEDTFMRHGSVNEVMADLGDILKSEPLDAVAETTRSWAHVTHNLSTHHPMVKTVEPNSVDYAAITEKIVVEGYRNVVPVVPRAQNPESVKTTFNEQNVKNAHSKLRAAGSEGANAAVVLGSTVLHANEASAIGPMAMAMVALLLLLGGSHPTDAPTTGGPLQVRIVKIPDVSDFMEQNVDWDIIYVPASMNVGALSALLALRIPGGTGAYDWAGPNRAGAEPIGSKYLLPSGQFRRIAVVTEAGCNRYDNIVASGRSITAANCRALVNHYTRVMNLGSLYAAALKIASAVVWGYGELRITNNAHGTDVDGGISRTTVDANNINMVGPRNPGPRPALLDGAHPPATVAYVWGREHLGVQDLLRLLFDTFGRLTLDRAEGDTQAQHRARAAETTFTARGSGFQPHGVVLVGFEPRDEISWTTVMAYDAVRHLFGRPRGPGFNGAYAIPAALVTRVTALDVGNCREALNYVLDAYDDMPLIPVARGAHPDPGTLNMYNVYGQHLSHEVTPQWPASNRDGFLALLAGISMLPAAAAKMRRTQGATIDNAGLFDAARRYASRLHFLTCHARYRNGMTADVTGLFPVAGRTLMGEVPEKYRSGFFPAEYTPDTVRGNAVDCYEPGTIMYGANRAAPYQSFGFDASWRVGEGATVNLSKTTGRSGMPGVDAAIRYTAQENGAIDVVTRIARHVVLIRTERTVGAVVQRTTHSFGIPRHANVVGNRGLSGVEIAASMGILAVGSSSNFPKFKVT